MIRDAYKTFAVTFMAVAALVSEMVIFLHWYLGIELPGSQALQHIKFPLWGCILGLLLATISLLGIKYTNITNTRMKASVVIMAVMAILLSLPWVFFMISIISLPM